MQSLQSFFFFVKFKNVLGEMFNVIKLNLRRKCIYSSWLTVNLKEKAEKHLFKKILNKVMVVRLNFI